MDMIKLTILSRQIIDQFTYKYDCLLIGIFLIGKKFDKLLYENRFTHKIGKGTQCLRINDVRTQSCLIIIM
jgi:hypothetical protein